MNDPETTDPANDALERDTVIDGRYRIICELGRGGMGTVYAAEQIILRKPVALKVMQTQAAGMGANSRKRFAREARILSSIKHRNVVDIIDFGELDDQTTYYVMERLEGRDLSALIKQEGPLSWSRARGLLDQALAALSAAHDNGIVHRDVKPANIMVLDAPDQWGNEQIKVLDFGIAKLQAADEQSQALTGTSEILGTAAYMAPELILGQPPDARTDLYAMGIVAYRMLTGVAPFQSDNTFKLLTQHLQDAPAPLRTHVVGIPAPVEAFVLRALSKKPEGRHSTAEQMRRDLETLSDDALLGSAEDPGVYDADPTLQYQASGAALASTMVAPQDMVPTRRVEPRELSPRVDRTLAAPERTVVASPPHAASLSAQTVAAPPSQAPLPRATTAPHVGHGGPKSNLGLLVVLTAVLAVMAGIAVGMFL